MGTNKHEAELREDVRAARAQYNAMAEQHERLLRYAHGAPCGSSDMLKALRCANALGPYISRALRRYLDTIEILSVFCEQVQSPDACVGGQVGDLPHRSITARL